MSAPVRHPLFARFYAWLAPREDTWGVEEYRRRLTAGLAGEVVEVGVGTGLSFRHYPAAVTRLVAVEPEPTMRANAAPNARAAPVPVELVDGTADALPLPDGAMDAAVLSQVLCSVPDQARALAEVRRVLKPGGILRFYEHVRSPRPAGVRVQEALDATVWPRMMGNCHLARDTAAAIRDAGFDVRELRGFRVGPTPAAPHILGAAVAPASAH